MFRDLEGVTDYERVIEDQVTNWRGYGAHMDPGFKLGRESTMLIQLSLGYAELDVLDQTHRTDSTSRGRVRKDVGDLREVMIDMDQRGLSGFYLRLRTPEDVVGALREYQRFDARRRFHN
jgi:hypothetical protein